MQKIARQDVSFRSGKEWLAGYLTRPVGAGPFPAVVIVHEVYGLNDNVKEIARRFAQEGYVALAVDLFSKRNRAVCIFRLFAGMFLNSLEHGGIHDLRSALNTLSAHPDVDANRLGAIGFCMGGGLVIAWSCTDDRLNVIAPYYATNPRPLEAVKRACPVVGSYPGKDFTTSDGRKLDAALDGYGISHDIKVYPGTMHSFFNDHGPTFNAAASDDSWQRTLAFFRERIG